MAEAATAGSVRDALGGAGDALAAAGVDSPRLDAELLLAEATGWERARLAAEPEAGVPAAAARRFGEMVRRRLRREPVAYILGRKGFRQIELAVDRRVLVPRPETELLVELALELRPRRVLDMGTGSGAVALAIADELPGCELLATDTSDAALEVARANAASLGLAELVEFHATMLPPAPPRLDLVVANLPYVAEADWGGLEPEVTEWEPREALLGGPDGLDVIRAAVAVAATVAPSLALEVGAGQASAVSELLFAAGFATVETRPDLAGIPRVVWGKK
ncbi:MAG TPA: peptide chain release factor N(5)-glutamine methyltransferase [Solirubrobacterales bacterium]|nr:peptide chain release factor N(5)-glutamine methyltransferase [Solirubrobacterales bacterium]